MSMIQMIGVLIIAAVAAPSAALAAKMPRSSANYESSNSSSGYRPEMLMDFSAHYVRGTKAEDDTDTAARFSIGGMFNSWIGLDFQTLYEVRSKSYLVGGDVRLAPNEWFFLKTGIGGYSNKDTRELSFTPLAGAGIMARVTSELYFVTEASYFQINKRDNISFGGGIGASF